MRALTNLKRRVRLPGHVRQHAAAALGFFDREEPPVLQDGVAVGHARHVVGDRARGVLPRALLEFRGQQAGVRRGRPGRARSRCAAPSCSCAPRGSGGRDDRAGSASAPGSRSRTGAAEGDERRRARAPRRSTRAPGARMLRALVRMRSVTRVSIIRRTVSWIRRRPASRGCAFSAAFMWRAKMRTPASCSRVSSPERRPSSTSWLL